MPDGSSFLFYLIGAALVVAVVVVIVWSRKARRKPSRSRYVEALNALLEGDEETALRELRQTVQVETGNADAYLRLGNLLRKRGAIDRALRIHRDLDVGTFFRRPVSPEERFRIREAIADDLLAARRTDEALQVLGELLKSDKLNDRIRSKMIGIHERRSEWDEAFELFREGLRARKEKAPEKLARYRAFCGTALLEAGEKEQAKKAFLEALKLDANTPEALYRLGSMYYEVEDLTEAIVYWERFHRAAPDQAHVTFERFERALFETGNLNRMMEVYETILAAHPREERTLLALSTFHHRRGETDKAIELAQRAVESNPSSAAARNRLTLLLCESDDPKEAAAFLSRFLKDHLPPAAPIVCSNCGSQAAEPFWRCPQCLKWNTAFESSRPSSSRS